MGLLPICREWLDYKHLWRTIRSTRQETSCTCFPNQTANTYSEITIPGAWRVPKGATLDVQVQVISGQIQPDDKWYYFAGEFGDWSNTQTVVVSDPPTPNDPYSPSTDQYLAPSATVPVFTPQNSTEPQNTFPTPIPAESVSPSQSPTATPMQPNTVTENPIGLDWSIVAFVILFGCCGCVGFCGCVSAEKVKSVWLEVG